MSDRLDGDVGPVPLRPKEGRVYDSPEAIEQRRKAVLDATWTMGRQLHGARVAVVDSPRGELEHEADALVTAAPNTALCVLGADCAIIGLSSPQGIIGAVHAGWRGVVAGVIPAAIETMQALGAKSIEAVLGPLVHPECYEFSSDELGRVEAVVGAPLSSTTSRGTLALDLPRAIEHQLASAGAVLRVRLGGCTSCDSRFFSHRARGEYARHGLVIWREVRP